MNDNLIIELYKKCGGRKSHFLFLDSWPSEIVDKAQKDGLIRPVRNNDNKAWFAITDKLLSAYEEQSNENITWNIKK